MTCRNLLADRDSFLFHGLGRRTEHHSITGLDRKYFVMGKKLSLKLRLIDLKRVYGIRHF